MKIRIILLLMVAIALTGCMAPKAVTINAEGDVNVHLPSEYKTNRVEGDMMAEVDGDVHNDPGQKTNLKGSLK